MLKAPECTHEQVPIENWKPLVIPMCHLVNLEPSMVLQIRLRTTNLAQGAGIRKLTYDLPLQGLGFWGLGLKGLAIAYGIPIVGFWV